MHLNGFNGIGRAAWPEAAARPQQGANGVLIDLDTANHDDGEGFQGPVLCLG